MHSFHIRILSTQKGIMADRDAVKASLGVKLYVYVDNMTKKTKKNFT